MEREKRYFRVMGMRRSGNHAVILWMKQNLSYESFHFVNEMTPGMEPQRAFTAVAHNDDYVGAENMDVEKARALVRKLPSSDTAIFSYEDPHVGRILFENRIVTRGYDDKITMNVVITREFLNWLASYWKLTARRAKTEEMTLTRLRDLSNGTMHWLVAQVAVREAQFKNRPDCVWVDYDRWFHSASHRAELAGALGLDYADTALPQHSSFGGGSSFEVGAAPETLKIAERWRQVVDDDGFKEVLELLLRDATLRAYLKAYFPETYQIIQSHFAL